MELIKIEIENYKSITEAISVLFNKSLPTVLIGKNGSGKTNILEAIEHIAATNTNLPGKYSANGLRYKLHIRLDSSEFAELFPNEEYSDKSAEFVAYPSEKNSLYINTIKSDTIVPLLKKELDNFSELAEQLRRAVESYEKSLLKIECDDRDTDSIRGYEIIDAKRNTTNYVTLKFQSEFFIEQIKQYLNYMSQNFKSENIFVYSSRNYSSILLSPHKELSPFKLRYKAPELAPFEQKFITVNETAIKSEITKINKKTEDDCKKINEILNRLKIQTERLAKKDDCGVITNFIRKVNNIFGNNCGYILSENSQLLFRDLKKENDNCYYNSSQIIFEAYAKSNNKQAILDDKNYKPNDEELKEFEKWLNENRPEFDKGMYDKILVTPDKNDMFSIELCENSGEKVSLNETSSGRRWYFTYYFVKNTLNSGDTFIIDEPASMLHPSAQKEILSDILEMTKKDIRVIYSTHSPYLIPKDWNCVGFVNMSDKTEVIYVNAKNEIKTLSKSIFEDIFYLESVLESVLEHYKKSDPYIIAENCYQAIKNKDKTLTTAAKELNISEETIKSWHRKGDHFRSPKFENVIAIASFLDINIEELLR